MASASVIRAQRMTPGTLMVAQAERQVADGVDCIEVGLYNGGVSPVGPGGLLMRVQSSMGYEYRMSVSNHWPIEAGGKVFVSAVLPKASLKWVDFVSYVEPAGRTHLLGSRFKFGWVFSSLIQPADETNELR